ncbi:hypothetical protein PDL71_04535 [Lacibacter sp. MH-610]
MTQQLQQIHSEVVHFFSIKQKENRTDELVHNGCEDNAAIF